MWWVPYVVSLVAGGVSGIATILVGLFTPIGQKWMTSHIERAQARDIETFKAGLNGQLEQVKLEANRQLELMRIAAAKDAENLKLLLRVEQEQQTIILNTQKTSFSKVIRAMDDVIVGLEDQFDWSMEGFGPLPEKYRDAYRRAIDEESLFVDQAANEILRFFLDRLHLIVRAPVDDEDPDSERVRAVWYELQFLRDCICEHFQYRVGLEVPHKINPLFAAQVYAAVSLYSSQPPKAADPRVTLDWKRAVPEVAAIAEEHLPLVISALEQFASERRDEEGISSYRYNQIMQAERYMKILRAGRMAS